MTHEFNKYYPRKSGESLSVMLQLTTGPRFTRPGKPMDEVERYSWILEFMPHDKRAYLPRYPNKQCSNLCVLLLPGCCPKLSERLCLYHLGNANRAVTSLKF